MKCVICNNELGRKIQSVEIKMLGTSNDCLVCPICHEVINKLRQTDTNMFLAGSDIYLSVRPVKSLDVKFG